MQSDREVFEHLLRTIENNARDNEATITNVDLWAKGWREELYRERVTVGIVMDIREEVNSYKTKHKHGFTRDEYMKLLENYPNINMERFYDALNGITCMSIDDENVVFHHDIELAIRCGIEDRSPTTMEWD